MAIQRAYFFLFLKLTFILTVERKLLPQLFLEISAVLQE